MLTLSKPISASQAQAYHRSEFANAKENYYTEGERVRGEWQGQLAERYGLRGEVNEEQFARLSEGQHPATGEALIRRQQAHEYVNDKGETVRAMEHRAGWDATFSAPKSVSITALVGGDNRVREAHRESVSVALDEMEKYAQARIGGNAVAQTTGAWAVAKFEHDSRFRGCERVAADAELTGDETTPRGLKLCSFHCIYVRAEARTLHAAEFSRST